MSGNRSPQLDGTRGVAILLVLLFHLSVSDSSAPVLVGGFLGVDIFFVLSGYLISSILYREYARTSHVRIGRFYIRRALRLFPALAVLLLFAVGYSLFLAPPETAAKLQRGILAASFYYSNWIAAYESVPFNFLTHLWSLAVEEQFYIIWPILFWSLLHWSSSRRSLILIISVLIALSACAKGYYFSTTGFFLRPYNGTDTRADGLLIGGVFALLTGWGMLKPKTSTVFLSVLTIAASTYFLRHDSAIYYYGGATVFALLTGLVISAVTTTRVPVISSMLSNRILCRCGTLSYSLYLWHLPVHGVLWEQGVQKLPQLIALPLYLLATFGVSTLSYLIIERPFLRLKSKFSADA